MAEAASSIPAADNNTGIAELQRSVRLVREYAVYRAQVPISDELIGRVTHLLRLDPANVAEAGEADLWKCLNELNRLVHPATVESIRITRSLERDQASASLFMIFRRGSACEPELQIARACASMLAWLVIVLLVQVYTLILSSLVTSVEDARGQFRAARADRSQIVQAASGGEQTGILDAADIRLRSAELELQASAVTLWRVSCPWRLAFTVTKDALPPNIENTPAAHAALDQISVQKAAAAVLRALALYVLPFLYGLLGASAYILRRLSRQLDDATFTVTGRFKYRLRLALGALLGATVGLFTTSEGATLSGVGIGMVALAFLAGYSVEFAFSIFDVIIDRLRKAFGIEGNKPLTAEPTPGGGGGSRIAPVLSTAEPGSDARAA